MDFIDRKFECSVVISGALLLFGNTIVPPPGDPRTEILLDIKINEAKLDKIIIFINFRTFLSSFSFEDF